MFSSIYPASRTAANRGGSGSGRKGSGRKKGGCRRRRKCSGRRGSRSN